MKVGSLAYVPPPSFPGALAFLENLKRFPARNELILYSNHPYDGCVKINDPEFFKGAPKSGEPLPGTSSKWVVNNAIFITGMRIAKKSGFSHVIYLEADCRVGQAAWDQTIFHEFFTLGFPYICAGTLVCWNPFNSGLEVARRWEELISSKNKQRNFPIPTYGVRREAFAKPDQGNTCIFPNGALGVYDMGWMDRLIDINNSVEVAHKTAWDFYLGERIWQTFGIQAFDMVAQLNSVFSGYGDEVTTLDQRLTMLKTGEVAAVHQVKGDVSYP